MDSMVDQVVAVLDEATGLGRLGSHHGDEFYRAIKGAKPSTGKIKNFKVGPPPKDDRDDFPPEVQKKAIKRMMAQKKYPHWNLGYDPRTKQYFPLSKVKPAKTTGERDTYEKTKERERKDIKRSRPNASLKWDGQRWKIRQKEKEKIMEIVLSLQEISLRTGFIGGFLLKVRQYGSEVDKGVNKLKSLSSSLNTVNDDKERDKIHSEIVKTDGDVFQSLRRMIMYVGLVSGSGGLGGDRTYKLLKKMEKQIKR